MKLHIRLSALLLALILLASPAVYALEPEAEASGSGTQLEDRSAETQDEAAPDATEGIDASQDADVSEDNTESVYNDDGTLKEGVYRISATSSYKMIKLANGTVTDAAILSVTASGMRVTLDLVSTTTWQKLYVAGAEDVVYLPAVSSVSRYTVPVSSLSGITCGALSASSGEYKSVTFSFDLSAIEKLEADAEPLSSVEKSEDDAEEDPIYADDGSLREGVYTISVTSSYKMIKLANGTVTDTAILSVTASGMRVTLDLASTTTWQKLYVAGAEDVVYLPAVSSVSRYTLPVSSLSGVTCSALSASSGEYKSVTFSFDLSAIEKLEADAEPLSSVETAEEPETPTDPETPADPEAPAQEPVTAEGTVETGEAMFKVTDCLLYIDNGALRAKVTLSGTGYDYLYAGSAEDAEAAADEEKLGYTEDENGKYVYDVPVSALDTPIPFASHSLKKDLWYDRTMTFVSSGLSEAFLAEVQALLGTPEGDSDAEGETGDSGSSEDTDTSGGSQEGSDTGAADTSDSTLNGSTARVDASTGLADGTYTPDSFTWSGGTGKTTISCTSITVKNGQAYATIVFSSEKYGYVKANGTTYYGTSGNGISTFTIPVELNKNNSIIGMTTAMSTAHEITYTIRVNLAAALTEDADPFALDGHITESIDSFEYAELVSVCRYTDGCILIVVKGVGSWLLVPEDAADADAEYEDIVVISCPVENACVYSAELFDLLNAVFSDSVLPCISFTGFTTDSVDITAAGTAEAPDYAALLRGKCGLVLLPESFADARVTGNTDEDAPAVEALDDDTAAALKEASENLSTYGLAAFIDCSVLEETEAGRLEWVRIYGLLFGCEAEALAYYEAQLPSVSME